MPAVILSDTSCLILLDKIGRLDLLQKLFGQIVVTQIIAGEFGRELPEWILIRNPVEQRNQQILEAILDKGEASAIALAMEQEACLLIMDESRGRRWATKLDIEITGTLGVLAQAKKNGYIPFLKPLLDEIGQTNFRLSERLVQATLREVGE